MATRRSIEVSTGTGPAVLDVPAQCCSTLAEPDMTAEEAEVTASVFKALGDPARVRIVNMLSTSAEPVCVCDLTPQLGLAQPTVSFHLKKLMQVGLLEREQRGAWAFYRLNRDAVARLGDIVGATEGDR